MSDIWHLLRPRRWLKSVLVLMPMPFAKATGNSFDPMVVGLGSIAMSSANSATYIFNDCRDAERDRLHTN